LLRDDTARQRQQTDARRCFAVSRSIKRTANRDAPSPRAAHLQSEHVHSASDPPKICQRSAEDPRAIDPRRIDPRRSAPHSAQIRASTEQDRTPPAEEEEEEQRKLCNACSAALYPPPLHIILTKHIQHTAPRTPRKPL